MDAEDVRRVLSNVVDPELGLDIVSLGLVYRVDCKDKAVEIDLTMTTPSCPLGEHIREEAERKVAEAFPGTSVDVELVWSPPWEPARMSDEAKASLGWG
jgi:metal-sulfur cluster biosynthetic enzyme